ncbi:MAG: radical SAM protein [Frankia sp.]
MVSSSAQSIEISDRRPAAGDGGPALNPALSDWLAELVRKSDDWFAGHGVRELLVQEIARANPQSWFWVDVYPRWRDAPESDPEQMLRDWRAGEYNRIEFLYLHLPFCAQRCHFCYYFISTDFTHSQDYLEMLRREVRTFLTTLPAAASAGALFIGGGTPSMMPVDDLQRLYDEVYEHLDRDRIGMVTLELHPRTMRRGLHRLAATGHIRRVSMGVQTFSRPVLEANGRIWVEPERIRKIATEFREAGVEHIGLDFMVGLHTETVADVLADLGHIAMLAREGLIDSVSVYPRSFTEIWGPFAGEVVDDQTLTEKFRSHLLYRTFFEDLGWTEGPMYLFTSPTFKAAVPSALVNGPRTAQSLAFGNSARSTFADTNYLNNRSPDTYREIMGSHSGATSAHQPFTRAEINRRHLHFGVKRGSFDVGQLPVSPSAPEATQLDAVTDDLVRRELVRRNGSLVELTDVGKLLVELVHHEYEQTFPEPEHQP